MATSRAAFPLVELNWTTEDIKKVRYRSLIDQEEGKWHEEEGSLKKEQVLKNPRIQAMLKNGGKYGIVGLPDERAVSRFFTCVACSTIPFPTRGNATFCNMAVFLCQNGHALCQLCHNKYGCCMFTMKEYTKIYGSAPTLETTQDHTKPVETPLGNFGTSQLCGSPKTDLRCGFLEEMIWKAEFACKYWPQYCPFRGRGSALVRHQANCTYWSGLKTSGEEGCPENVDEAREKAQHPAKELKPGRCADESSSHDEQEIRHFRLEKAREEARELAKKLFHERGKKINPPRRAGFFRF